MIRFINKRFTYSHAKVTNISANLTSKTSNIVTSSNLIAIIKLNSLSTKRVKGILLASLYFSIQIILVQLFYRESDYFFAAFIHATRLIIIRSET